MLTMQDCRPSLPACIFPTRSVSPPVSTKAAPPSARWRVSGFGSIEIGSISIDPSSGNPKPRLWRLPEDDAIVVHYGLPNDGAEVIARRIAGIRLPVTLGVNLVVTNRGLGAAPLGADQIIGEYVTAAKILARRADYLMLKIFSCPNTIDGRDFFADAGHLDACLAAFGESRPTVPVFLKVSPLGGIAAIERILAAADGRDFVRGFMFNLPPVKPRGHAHAGSGLARNARCSIRPSGRSARRLLHPRNLSADGSQAPRIDRHEQRVHGRGCLCENPARRFASATVNGIDLSRARRGAGDHRRASPNCSSATA